MAKKLHPKLAEPKGRAARIAEIIDEMKGEQIVVLDMGLVCDFTDAFVIATLRSSTHMKATVQTLLRKLREEGLRPLEQPSGASERWMLIDFSDVIVHLFDRQTREFYDLESLWGDAARIAWQEALRAS
mgnify:FL=1